MTQVLYTRLHYEELPAIAEPRLPTNFAYLEITRSGFRWIIPYCLICRLRHLHGGGGPADDPRQFLNHRAAYCTSRGYFLRDGSPAVTADLVYHAQARRRVV